LELFGTDKILPDDRVGWELARERNPKALILSSAGD
jgi:hypothetical protein